MSSRVTVLIVTVVVSATLLGGATFLPPMISDVVDTASGESDVSAAHSTMHVDRTGRPTVVGEVINRRGTAIDSVEVRVTFTEDGQPVATENATVPGVPIGAGDATPFAVRTDENVDPDGYTVDVTYDRAEHGPADHFEITDVRVDDSSQDQIFVTGSVRNRGDETATVAVAATFYDENGSVIGTRMVRSSPDRLGPDEAGVFQIRFRTLGEIPSRAREFADYQLRAYALS